MRGKLLTLDLVEGISETIIPALFFFVKLIHPPFEKASKGEGIAGPNIRLSHDHAVFAFG